MTKSSKIIAALGVIAGIGVASLPLGSFADTTYSAGSGSADVTVQLTVLDTISIAVDQDTCAATATAYDYKTCSTQITYGTNKANGAKLYVKDKDTTLTLTGADTAAGDTLAAGTFAVNAKGEGKWGLSGGSFGTTITAITAENAEIGSLSEAASETVTMTAHFSTKANQKPGVYTDIITYTATAN